MTASSLIADQANHYRDLAKTAQERARKDNGRRRDLLALAKGWLALAVALEHSFEQRLANTM